MGDGDTIVAAHVTALLALFIYLAALHPHTLVAVVAACVTTAAFVLLGEGMLDNRRIPFVRGKVRPPPRGDLPLANLSSRLGFVSQETPPSSPVSPTGAFGVDAPSGEANDVFPGGSENGIVLISSLAPPSSTAGRSALRNGLGGWGRSPRLGPVAAGGFGDSGPAADKKPHYLLLLHLGGALGLVRALLLTLVVDRSTRRGASSPSSWDLTSLFYLSLVLCVTCLCESVTAGWAFGSFHSAALGVLTPGKGKGKERKGVSKGMAVGNAGNSAVESGGQGATMDTSGDHFSIAMGTTRSDHQSMATTTTTRDQSKGGSGRGREKVQLRTFAEAAGDPAVVAVRAERRVGMARAAGYVLTALVFTRLACDLEVVPWGEGLRGHVADVFAPGFPLGGLAGMSRARFLTLAIRPLLTGALLTACLAGGSALSVIFAASHAQDAAEKAARRFLFAQSQSRRSGKTTGAAGAPTTTENAAAAMPNASSTTSFSDTRNDANPLLPTTDPLFSAPPLTLAQLVSNSLLPATISFAVQFAAFSLVWTPWAVPGMAAAVGLLIAALVTFSAAGATAPVGHIDTRSITLATATGSGDDGL